jgi:hypothetical protein
MTGRKESMSVSSSSKLSSSVSAETVQSKSPCDALLEILPDEVH